MNHRADFVALVLILLLSPYPAQSTVVWIEAEHQEISIFDSNFSLLKTSIYENTSSDTYNQENIDMNRYHADKFIDKGLDNQFYSYDINETAASTSVYRHGIDNDYNISSDFKIKLTSQFWYNDIIGFNKDIIYLREPGIDKSIHSTNSLTNRAINITSQENITIDIAIAGIDSLRQIYPDATETISDDQHVTSHNMDDIMYAAYQDVIFIVFFIQKEIEVFDEEANAIDKLHTQSANSIYFQQYNTTSGQLNYIHYQFDNEILSYDGADGQTEFADLVFETYVIDQDRVLIYANDLVKNSMFRDSTEIYTYVANFEDESINRVNFPQSYFDEGYEMRYLGMRDHNLYIYFIKIDEGVTFLDIETETTYTSIYYYDMETELFAEISGSSAIFTGINTYEHDGLTTGVMTFFFVLKDYMVMITHHTIFGGGGGDPGLRPFPQIGIFLIGLFLIIVIIAWLYTKRRDKRDM